jgi:hypothetical protein
MNPPKYFATLSAYKIDPNVPDGTPGRCKELARDDPNANWFRFELNLSNSISSAPIGSDRMRAESVVQYLNRAYNFGLEHAAHQEKNPILVGRMGYRNRNEESMP